MRLAREHLTAIAATAALPAGVGCGGSDSDGGGDSNENSAVRDIQPDAQAALLLAASASARFQFLTM